jgi:hypothetical protein
MSSSLTFIANLYKERHTREVRMAHSQFKMAQRSLQSGDRLAKVRNRCENDQQKVLQAFRHP